MLTALVLGSCDTVDCSLNNTVFCYLSFYNAEGQKVALKDTLSITAYGTETVLYNRGVGKSDVAIPMSYYNDADTLVFTLWGKDYRTSSTVVVDKKNVVHFESPDCPVNMFHDITTAKVTRGKLIDSVKVVKPSVNYQRDENLRLYVN